ncbi:MAG: GNAT family N-acetyltransferase [Kangiellaceae bacterium]|nr:GNAT family N-acetyltransferase [Kangiellaceae bacterium]
MTEKDADLLFQLDQDSEVMKYINGGKLSSREQIERISLPRIKSYTNQAKGWGLWKVTLTETTEFFGWILVRPMDYFSYKPQYQNLELGWRFNRRSWGKGYATEAAIALKQSIIQKGAVSKLSAIAMEDNHASIKIMVNLGMQYVKTYTHKDTAGGMEVVLYELAIHHSIHK